MTTSSEQEQEYVLCRGLPPQGEPGVPGIFLIFLGISLLLLNGCGTIYALQKLPPQVQLSKYESVFLSQDNDIVFRFNVSIEETKVNKQGFKVRQLNANVEQAMWKERHEEIWCAKLPYDDVLRKSAVIDKLQYSKQKTDYWRTIKNISTSYKIVKSDCLNNITVNHKIPYTMTMNYDFKDYNLYKLSNDTLKTFIHNNENVSLLITALDNTSDERVAKLEVPINNDWSYSKFRLVLLPVLFVADIVFFPVELLYFYSAH